MGRVEELEGVLAEVLATLPHLPSSAVQRSVVYHELYVKVWNTLEPIAEKELWGRLFGLCQWYYSGVERGPGVGWVCGHGFFMSTLTPRSLTNLEGYHEDYIRRDQ